MEIPDNPVKLTKSSSLVFMIFAFLVHAVIGCQDNPVGIAHSSIIPDDRFAASSYYNSRYVPKNARLNVAGRGWGPRTESDPNDYLQIDLGQEFTICAVATQGCSDCIERTTEYKISTSVDNNIWTTYKIGSVDKLFTGNTDSNTVVKNVLDVPVQLRYIRFIPTAYNAFKVLRVEAYRLRRGCLSSPVGIADTSIIPDDRFTTSSYYDQRYAPKNARLNGATGRGWAPKTTSDPNDYLQIDLGQVFAVCAVATQGATRVNEWTTQYKISTSVDNNIWNTHKAGSADKLFTGNTDRTTVVKNVLDIPVLLRYIRFIPTTYSNWKVLRVEAYGFRRRCMSSPVGIADTSTIPDDRFTASSHYDHRYVPKNARLNGAGRGWAPKTTTDPNDYLQIDLGQVLVICAVATQGCNGVNEWTTHYKISTSVDNNTWTAYKSGSADKLFAGNTDGNTFAKNVLNVTVLLRYIRFIPTRYNNWKVLRVEAYGVRRGVLCTSLPVGIGSGKIPDSGMTSSSAYNSTTSPSKARLNYTPGSSWCAATSDSSPYLQINLRSPYIICGIATQGDHMTDQWVQSYHMLTSSDGTKFTKYTENSQTRSFTGNYDSSTAVKDILYDGTVSQYIRVAPTIHYGSTNCMRTELYGIQQDGDCTSMPVGLSSSSIIPDHRLTASSLYDARYLPSNARLKAHRKAWAPKTKSGGDWLQIDLGSVVFVCAVATQGTGYGHQEWIESYMIRVSLDNMNWNYYQENNIDKTFTGNTNKDDVVTKSLASPIKAKFIRFYPVTFKNYPSMRVEVYGISSGCGSPVGLEVPGVIQNSKMTSSSNLDNTHNASHGRLYGNSSWCSNTSSNIEYIQINLGQVMTVTGIATHGDHTMDKWVTTYTISYNRDDNLWNTYKDEGSTDKVFQSNSDKENITVQWLSHPVTARHVRVMPQTWNTAICMRIELYGCDYAKTTDISGLTNQNLTAASNSYVDLVCIVQEPLIQYIKWYTGNTDITSQSTGLVRGANGVKQSTLRVNYTSGDNVLNTYDCVGPVCSKAFVCKAMYSNSKTYGINSAEVTVNLDYPSTLAAPTLHNMKSTSVNITWTQPALKASQASVTKYVLQYQSNTQTQAIDVLAPATSHVITGLTIYTNYSVKIKATSRIGSGQWSETRNFTTDTPIERMLLHKKASNPQTNQAT